MRVPRVVIDVLILAAAMFWRRYGKNNFDKLHEGIGLFVMVLAGIFLAWDATRIISPATLHLLQRYFHQHVHVPPH